MSATDPRGISSDGGVDSGESNSCFVDDGANLCHPFFSSSARGGRGRGRRNGPQGGDEEEATMMWKPCLRRAARFGVNQVIVLSSGGTSTATIMEAGEMVRHIYATNVLPEGSAYFTAGYHPQRIGVGGGGGGGGDKQDGTMDADTAAASNDGAAATTATSAIYGAEAETGVEVERTAAAIQTLRTTLSDPHCVAVGPCGLDYSADRQPCASRERQLEWFRLQARLASEIGLPLLVHERDARGDVLDVLDPILHRVEGNDGADDDVGRNSAPPPPEVVMHNFIGTADEARTYLSRGYYLSLTGLLCRTSSPRGQTLRSMLRDGVLPLSSVVLGTDCPHAHPSNSAAAGKRRGGKRRRSEPANVVDVARTVAECLGVSMEEVRDVTCATTRRVLGLSVPAAAVAVDNDAADGGMESVENDVTSNSNGMNVNDDVEGKAGDGAAAASKNGKVGGEGVGAGGGTEEPEPEPTLRLFVAIELPDTVREMLGNLTVSRLVPHDVVLPPADEAERHNNDADASAVATDDAGAPVEIEPDNVGGAGEQAPAEANDNGVGGGSIGAVRWIQSPSLYHCTLQFLGNVKESQVEPLSTSLEGACAVLPGPLALSLGEVGCMPNLRKARVLKVGLGPREDIVGVARAVCDATAPHGFEADRRKFNAHITLGRVKTERPKSKKGGGKKRGRGKLVELPDTLVDALEEARNAMVDAPTSKFDVAHVSLVQSVLSSSGPEYTTLRRFPLGKREQVGGLVHEEPSVES